MLLEHPAQGGASEWLEPYGKLGYNPGKGKTTFPIHSPRLLKARSCVNGLKLQGTRWSLTICMLLMLDVVPFAHDFELIESRIWGLDEGRRRRARLLSAQRNVDRNAGLLLSEDCNLV